MQLQQRVSTSGLLVVREAYCILGGREVELGGGDDLDGEAIGGPGEARGGVDGGIIELESDDVRSSGDQRVGSYIISLAEEREGEMVGREGMEEGGRTIGSSDAVVVPVIQDKVVVDEQSVSIIGVGSEGVYSYII